MKKMLKKTARRDTQTIISCSTARGMCQCWVRYCTCSGPSEYVTNDSWQFFDNSANIYR